MTKCIKMLIKSRIFFLSIKNNNCIKNQGTDCAMQNKVLYFHISFAFDMQTKYKNALHDKNKSYMRGVWVDDAY